MTTLKFILISALLACSGVSVARADCQIADANLEEAILNKPQLRGTANRQAVRDLRSLRDAAFTLQSYGRHDDCERLLANIRELISGPVMSSLGDNDEERAERQNTAREPLGSSWRREGVRDKKGAQPLVRITELAPGLRADEIIGAEVRSSDDKIVGEVRNIVFGTKDGRDYAIVASGGFFTAGKNSIVVPIQSLQVSQERASFFLPLSKEAVGGVPLMPDADYKWLSDLDGAAKTTPSSHDGSSPSVGMSRIVASGGKNAAYRERRSAAPPSQMPRPSRHPSSDYAASAHSSSTASNCTSIDFKCSRSPAVSRPFVSSSPINFLC